MRGRTPRAQADAGMGEIKRQLIYKGEWRHTRVTLASVWFPSSKTCSACGAVNGNLKREPRWTCPECGTTHERNLNAAINLRNLIMPSGRRRDGEDRNAVAQQGPPGCTPGSPWRGYRSPAAGSAKVATPWTRNWSGNERGGDRGTTHERNPNPAINLKTCIIMRQGRRRDGRGGDGCPTSACATRPG